MTLQSEIKNDPKYITVLDHGFVGLVDYMGSDSSIVQAARVSYGSGTKTVREDRGLIRYLMRHKHTSPFEMCQIKLHLKLPIFVMRQLVRHRTSSLNEYSGRYSIMTDEFYIPQIDNIKPQSTNNKQGRDGILIETDAQRVIDIIEKNNRISYDNYQVLLNSNTISEEYPGIARELARTVLPINNYTELYWSQNLHNMFHLLKLRMDNHSQWEIQEFARAIYSLISPLFPMSIEAFEDYINSSKNLSKMEFNILHDAISQSITQSLPIANVISNMIQSYDDETSFLEHYRLSKREWAEFKELWGL